MFFTQTANQIEDLSVDSLQSNSEIEVFSISNILTNSIHFVKSNLDRISTSPSSIEGNLTRIQTLLDLAQTSTSNLTDGYYFLDKNGTVITYSDIDKGIFPNYKGVNLSHRDYFEVPKQYGSSFISTVIESNDQIPRIYISTPILDVNQTQRQQILSGEQYNQLAIPLNNSLSSFKGVIVSAIAAEKLGNFLESQIHPKFNGEVGFIDRNGTVIHTSNQTFIGKNYYGKEFQSYLESVLKDREEGFNNIINKAFSSGGGVDQFDFENTSTTIAYEAVFGPQISSVNGNNRIGTLFITVPNTLAENVAALVDNQRITNISIIVIIIAISLIIALILLTWNKFLNDTVKLRTNQLRDTVDKLSKANENLNLHDKMQKEFINIAAHELRTPTQAISGNLELIEMIHLPSLFKKPLSAIQSPLNEEFENMVGDKEALQQFVSGLVSTYRNSQRLEQLVNSILEVSRIESERLELNKEYFNLNEEITHVISDTLNKYAGPTLSNKLQDSPNIVFRPFEDPITVFADRIRIFQVLTNLITNAIRFSKDKPITISVKKIQKNKTNIQANDNNTMVINQNYTKNSKDEKKMAIVTIRDRGQGIDSEILPRLFTKFTTKSSQGTGLGLYISKSIIEAHGGKIWAQNNYDGENGATFSFALPLDN